MSGLRKIFQVVECGGPGGTGAQVAAICNHLDPKRFETSLIYSVRPGSSPEEYRAQAHGAKNSIYLPEMTREISISNDWKAFQSLYRIFNEGKPDVVHAHSSKAGVLARAAARRAGVPRIYYSPHGYSFQMLDRSQLNRLAYRGIERFFSRIGEIVAGSPSEAALARSIAGNRTVHTVCDAYLGTIPPLKTKQSGDRVIGACGRMTFARHPEAFVKLAQRVTDSRNDVRFVWIGDGELRPKIEEMVRDMNLVSRLSIMGWLSPEEVSKQLADLDLFIHYSRWEGLPNSVLEAMAHGLAVAASDIPGNRDLIESGVNGVLAASEIELLERVLELVDNPSLRANLGQAGRKKIQEQFTLEKLIRSLEGLYSS